MVNGKTLHSRLLPDDVSDYVVLCGDPWRAEKLNSTRMRAPSAIAALEELYECDAISDCVSTNTAELNQFRQDDHARLSKSCICAGLSYIAQCRRAIGSKNGKI